MNRRLLSSLGLIAGLAVWGAPVQADEVADFYRGKTFTMVVGYSAGGGYDLYARAISRHIGKHIPGNPTVIVNNMPGAGSVASANYLYNVAPKDGLVIATFSRGLPMEPLIGTAKVQYDATKMTWIGSASNELSVCAVTQRSAVKNWNDFLAKESTLGGEAAGSDPDTYALMVRGLFGAKLRIVTGYPGGNDMTLAAERGEIDGRCGWSWSSIKATRPDWVSGPNKLSVLVQLSMERSKDLPDVPAAFELATTETQRAIIRLIVGRQVIARPFAAPPGIPPARRDALRKAFMDTLNDPAFLAEAKAMSLEIDPVNGADVSKLIADIYASPREIIDQARSMLAAGAADRNLKKD
jgi:tripartite-type tricarboxylate transporter receptor subunit TctC